MNDREFNDKIDELIKTFDQMSENLEKAQNSKRAIFFTFLFRLASIALFVGCIYAAVLGFGGSAAVLGVMFLTFWLIDRISVAVIGGFKGYAEGKTRELELYHEKYKKAQGPLV